SAAPDRVPNSLRVTFIDLLPCWRGHGPRSAVPSRFAFDSALRDIVSAISNLMRTTESRRFEPGRAAVQGNGPRLTGLAGSLIHCDHEPGYIAASTPIEASAST